jgi:hypothetical protein
LKSQTENLEILKKLISMQNLINVFLFACNKMLQCSCGNSSKAEYGISFVAEKAWVPENDLLVRVVGLLHRIGPEEGDRHDRNSRVSSERIGFA